jgi:hypothetical protein
MITKHFFKILIIFTVMIVLGLASVLLVSNSDKGIKKPSMLNNANTVAK